MNSLSDLRDLPDWLAPEVNGADLLNEVHGFFCRFVAFPSPHAAVACTLWAAHTHAMEAWESTPRLAFLSPEPGSGKSRALEIAELLVPRPAMAVNMSPAALFRIIGGEDGLPTILFDEIDTVFGPKAKDNEDLRGLLNAGWRRGAKTYRCAMHGRKVELETYEAFSAVALAGLGNLPDTILTRSIIVRIRRRAPGERVEPYRRREHAPAGGRLAEQLFDWAKAHVDSLADARPAMPIGIEDRPADVWEPLLAIADAVGGDWPRLARDAAVAMVTDAQDMRTRLEWYVLGLAAFVVVPGTAAAEEWVMFRLSGDEPVRRSRDSRITHC